MTNTTHRPNVAVKDAHGRQVYASVGAVAQHGSSLKVYACGTCGGEVVWATSARTGKPYLVNVSTGYHGQRYYIGSSLHRGTCDARMADRARYEAKAALRERFDAMFAAVQAARKAGNEAEAIRILDDGRSLVAEWEALR